MDKRNFTVLYGGRLAQRIWRVQVRDMDVMMHDPDLYCLAKHIEVSMGPRTRFMLRPADNAAEIRILVEASSAEKCLLAMLRFTQAAKKKGYLVGSAEEEEF